MSCEVLLISRTPRFGIPVPYEIRPSELHRLPSPPYWFFHATYETSRTLHL
jgi:hypothetical protein